jgi:carbon monoxide dehydrogenase subunit G
MIGITRSTVVHAPAARVFDHLADPRNMLEIWPSLLEVANPSVTADGGHAFDWTYRMAGIRFRGKCATVDVERGRRRFDRNTGGIPSTFRWTFTPRGEETEVALEIEYEIPVLVGWVAGGLLRAANEREAETVLSNLRTRLETGVVPVRRAA